jgi:hypothetical protein
METDTLENELVLPKTDWYVETNWYRARKRTGTELGNELVQSTVQSQEEMSNKWGKGVAGVLRQITNLSWKHLKAEETQVPSTAAFEPRPFADFHGQLQGRYQPLQCHP